MDFTQTSEFDGLVKSRKSDGKVKSSSSRRRESRVMRRTYRTSKAQRDEAQRRNWTFYEAIKFELLGKDFFKMSIIMVICPRADAQRAYLTG